MLLQIHAWSWFCDFYSYFFGSVLEIIVFIGVRGPAVAEGVRIHRRLESLSYIITITHTVGYLKIKNARYTDAKAYVAFLKT